LGILPKKAYDVWLNPTATVEELQSLLVPWARKMTVEEAPKSVAMKKLQPAIDSKALKLKKQ
jgi:putative SOS response-associated peptidase YedK